MSAGTLQHRTAQRGVRTGVGDDVGRHALDDTVLIAADGKLHLHGVPLGMDEDAFRPAELALHRPLGKVGNQSRQMLDRDILLTAKAAAYQHILHFYLFRRQAQHRSCLMLGIIGALVSGEDHHSVPIREGHSALRFQEGVLRVGGVETPGDHMLAAGNGQSGIAPLNMLVGQQIPAAVDQRCVVGHGLFRGTNRCKDFVLHLDHPLGFLQDLLGLSSYHTDGVTQIVGGTPNGDHGVPVLDDVTHLVLTGNILCSKYSNHTRQGQRFLLMDGFDDGPGMGAADSGGVNHAVHIHVVGVLAIALYFFRHVHTVDMGTQLPLPLIRFIGEMSLPQDPGGDLHTFHDLHIAGTAADIITQGKTDLLLGGIRIHIQQPFSRHHHTGDTEAALHRSRLPEAVGVSLLLKIAEAFRRDDGFSFQLIGRHNAGTGGFPVHQHGAGAAGALAAAVLHRGEPQLIPQKA